VSGIVTFGHGLAFDSPSYVGAFSLRNRPADGWIRSLIHPILTPGEIRLHCGRVFPDSGAWENEDVA